MRRLLLEDLEEAIVAVVVRMRGHGDEGVAGAGLQVAQAQGLGGGEERHGAMPRGWARARCLEGAEGEASCFNHGPRRGRPTSQQRGSGGAASAGKSKRA